MDDVKVCAATQPPPKVFPDTNVCRPGQLFTQPPASRIVAAGICQCRVVLDLRDYRDQRSPYQLEQKESRDRCYYAFYQEDRRPDQQKREVLIDEEDGYVRRVADTSVPPESR